MNIVTGEPKISFLQQLLEFWHKSDKFVACALFVLVGIGEHLNIPVVRDSALSVLGLIILLQFFDLARDRTKLKTVLTQISKRVDELAGPIPKLEQAFTSIEGIALAIRPRRRFKNINEVVPVILEYIKECNKNEQKVEIKWIGMTMWNVGATLIAAFDQLADEGTVKNLQLDVAMLEGKWLDANDINRAWDHARAVAGKNNIEKFFEAKKAGGLNWNCEVKTYAHMPGIHGGLINEKYLFLGMAQWLEDDLHAGQREYSVYGNQSKDDKEKIRIFKGWFEFCFRGRSRDAQAAAVAAGS